MEHFITIAAALIGSSMLSTGLGLFAARYNPTRHVDTLQAWNTERRLLSELENQAGIVDHDANTSARDLALATAARTQVNAAVATRLIPKNSLTSTVVLVSGLLLAFLAPIAVSTGIVFGLHLQEASTLFLAFAVALSGLVMIPLAALLIFIGFKSDVYRSIMRVQVQRILSNEPTPKQSSPKKSQWIPGHEPKYLKRHRITLSPDTLQSFSYFMKNATRSAGQDDSSAE